VATLRNEIVATDRASGVFSKVAKNLDGLEKKHASFGRTVASALSVAAVTAFGVSSVKAFAEAEKSQAKLELAYRKFPALANANIEALRDLNQALQDKTGADADQLASAQAVLAQFNLTGQEIQKLTPLLVDYATVTGQDVNSAAESLGKALMGNARALKAVGVDFKATGNTADDVATIMGKLQEKVGGAGDAFGQTTAGKLEIARASFEDLQEEIGEALVPALTGLVSVVKPVVNAFQDLPDPMKSAAVAAAAVGTAAFVATPKIKALVDMTREWSIANPAAASSAKNLAKGLGAVGIAYAALAGAAELSANWFARNNTSVDEFAESASKGGKAADEDLGKVYQALTKLNGVPDWAKAALGPFGQIVVGGDIKAAEEQVASFDEALSSMVADGNGDKAARMVTALGLSADDQAKRLPNYTQALKDSDKATKDVTGSTKNATSATTSFAAAWQAMTGTLSVLTAVVGAKDAQDKFAESLRKGGTALSTNTTAGRANITALNDAVVAIGRVKDAQEANGTSTGRATAQANAQITALRTAYIAAGGTAEAFDALTASIGKVPNNARTSVTAPGLSAAQNAARHYRADLDNVDGRTVTTRVRTVREIITNPFGTSATTGRSAGAVDKATSAITQRWSGGTAGADGGTVAVNLVLDGQVIQTSLLRLKRTQGGALGLS